MVFSSRTHLVLQLMLIFTLVQVTITAARFRHKTKDHGTHDEKDERKLSLEKNSMMGGNFEDMEKYVNRYEKKFLEMKEEIESNIKAAEEKNRKAESKNKDS